MLPQEKRRAVQGLIGFVEEADERLEDVWDVGGDVENHVDALSWLLMVSVRQIASFVARIP